MAKCYLEIVSASSGCFNLKRVIYFFLCAQSGGCGTPNDFSMYIADETVQWKRYCKSTVLLGMWVWKHAKKKTMLSVCACVRVCVWMSVPAFLSDWWWFLPLDMCWLFTFLKGTKHNATITINYFLNSVLICHFILLESSLLKSSATKWETLINSHVWWSWLKFLVSQCDELNCI